MRRVVCLHPPKPMGVPGISDGATWYRRTDCRLVATPEVTKLSPVRLKEHHVAILATRQRMDASIVEGLDQRRDLAIDRDGAIPEANEGLLMPVFRQLGAWGVGPVSDGSTGRGASGSRRQR